MGAGIIGFSLIQIILHVVKIIFIKYYCDKYSSPTQFPLKGNLIKYKVLKNIIFNSFFFYIGNMTNIIQNSTFVLLGARGMGIANIGFFILYRTVSNFSNQLQNFISSAFSLQPLSTMIVSLSVNMQDKFQSRSDYNFYNRFWF
jgi:hypothetical protein